MMRSGRLRRLSGWGVMAMLSLAIWHQVALWIIIAAVVFSVWPLYEWVSKRIVWLVFGILLATVELVDREMRRNRR